MQINSFGRMDTETVLNPEISFWKDIYKRHTPFAMLPTSIEFVGSVGYGRRVHAVVNRVGDLLSRVYLYIELGNLNAGAGGCRFVDDIGRALIDTCTLQIGSVDFDNLHGELIHALEELSTDSERQLGRFTGKSGSVAELETWAKSTQYLYIPLDFYFCDGQGEALPLVSLHLTDVKLYMKIRPLNELVVGVGAAYTPVAATDGLFSDMHLLCEVVLLDDDERDYFADTPLKYLFIQHQYLGLQTIAAGSTSHNIDVVFNHPTKELIMMQRTSTNTTALNWFDFSGEGTGAMVGEAFSSLRVNFTGNERVQQMAPFYYRVIQPHQHHTRIPKKHIYVYSFALNPEKKQASGSVNFSRIDNCRLQVVFQAALAVSCDWLIYAININMAYVQQGCMLLKYAS